MHNLSKSPEHRTSIELFYNLILRQTKLSDRGGKLIFYSEFEEKAYIVYSILKFVINGTRTLPSHDSKGD